MDNVDVFVNYQLSFLRHSYTKMFYSTYTAIGPTFTASANAARSLKDSSPYHLAIHIDALIQVV